MGVHEQQSTHQNNYICIHILSSNSMLVKKPIIKVSNLTKAYDKLIAVNGINFEELS